VLIGEVDLTRLSRTRLARLRRDRLGERPWAVT
jgi:hypothetical protein